MQKLPDRRNKQVFVPLKLHIPSVGEDAKLVKYITEMYRKNFGNKAPYQIGFDSVADSKKFTLTESGIVVITKNMVLS